MALNTVASAGLWLGGTFRVKSRQYHRQEGPEGWLRPPDAGEIYKIITKNQNKIASFPLKF